MTKNQKLIGLFLSFGLASVFLFSGRAHAAQIDIVPSTGDVSCSSTGISPCYTNLAMAEVSYSGTGVKLNANPSWTRLSYTTAKGDMRINDGCYGTNSDYPRPGCVRSGDGIAKFDVYRINNTGDVSSLCFSVDANDKWSSGAYKLQDGFSNWFDLDAAGCLGTIDNTTGLYGVLVRATLISPPSSGAINAYQIQTRAENSGQSSFAGFADSGKTGGVPTAIQNRATPSQDPNGESATNDANDSIQNNFVTRMRQVCDGSAPSKLHLEWQDADAGSGGSPRDDDVYWTVTVVDEWGNTRYTRTSMQEAGDPSGGANSSANISYIGGANAYRNEFLNYTVAPGDRVTWTWFNIRRINGVQMFLHYDNNFYGAAKRCGNIHGSLTTVNCTAIRGYAYDYNDISSFVRVHIFLDGNSTSGATQKIITANQNLGLTPAPPDGAHDFSANPQTLFGIGTIVNGSPHRFYIYGEDIDSAGNNKGVLYPLNGGNPTAAITCYPPPGFSCAVSATDPVSPEVSQPFTLSIVLTITGGDPAKVYNYSGYLTVATIYPGSNLIGSGSRTGAGPATMSKTLSSSQIGQFAADGLVKITGYPDVTCNSNTVSIYRKPYVRVYGGDVYAGGAFKDASGICSGATNVAKLLGRSDPGKGASGTELAAFALDVISDFASASTRSVGIPSAPTGLSFANTPPGTLGQFGEAHCVTDYFDSEQDNRILTTIPVGTIIPYSSGTLLSGRQTLVKGNLTLTGGNADVRHTIFVDGDVFINGSGITYASSVWPGVNNIPYFTVVARGNIYISSAVTQLDGLYIAQPDAGGGRGKIFTCRDSLTGGQIPDAAMESTCNTQLKVYGAFIADQLVLQRTHGTLWAGATYETASSPTAGNIAELFQGVPNLFIGQPVFLSQANLYDSIRALPPIAE